MKKAAKLNIPTRAEAAIDAAIEEAIGATIDVKDDRIRALAMLALELNYELYHTKEQLTFATLGNVTRDRRRNQSNYDVYKAQIETLRDFD